MKAFDSDVEFMNEMIVLMREDMIECSRILSKTYEEHDTVGLKNVAHRIKGQAAQLVAIPLKKEASRIEDSARAGFVTKLEYLCLVMRLQEFIKHTKKN